MPARTMKQRDSARVELKARRAGKLRDKFPKISDSDLVHFTEIGFHCAGCTASTSRK